MVIPAHRMRHGERQRFARRGHASAEDQFLAIGGARADDAMAISLTSPHAVTATVGAKAANLAKAARADLPVLPGFAIPVPIVGQAASSGGFADLSAEKLDGLHAAWRRLTRDDAHALVTRSSAVSEDAEGSSMAGRFRSVLDVRGWRAFLGALDEVAESATVISLDGENRLELHAMAILVQRFLPAAYGGVLFGADPVTGRTDRITLATVRGGPESLVSGEAGGSQQVLTPRGRLLHTDGDASVGPPARRLRELAALARRADAVFGGPQDIEWAVDRDGRLWLLQSRPVTTLDARPAEGPVLGPGPLAETFPDPLSTLEQELWLTPMREGIIHAIDLTGAVPRRRLTTSPVAVAVGGRAAVDLGLIGAIEEHGSFVRKLDPRPGARRLRAAWRTGRLRRALPALSQVLIASVDRELRSVPALSSIDDDQLVAVLHGTRRALVALHGQEILAGLLVPKSSAGAEAPTGAAVALASLQRARAAGIPEWRIPAAYPEVLVLVPPVIGPATAAPPTATLLAEPLPLVHPKVDPIAEARESLRMRIRWVEELAALTAWELGERLTARGRLDEPGLIRHLDLRELDAALLGHQPEVAAPPEAAPALPAMFRLDGAGRPFAVSVGEAKVGQGAGGGRRSGRVVHAAVDVTGGEPVVLVTSTLAPSLAAVLPGLAGLVSETGSVLSHLAILARELGVPTVVGVENASSRFPAGTVVVVDGATGSIEKVAP